jgi:hypothetical protein
MINIVMHVRTAQRRTAEINEARERTLIRLYVCVYIYAYILFVVAVSLLDIQGIDTASIVVCLISINNKK